MTIPVVEITLRDLHLESASAVTIAPFDYTSRIAGRRRRAPRQRYD